ncbi:hypothetical protein J7K42_01045 [bacterium]|nr:hypothetical protein [bacterium]
MAIEKYHFGSITINGKTYNHDVEVRWSGEVLDWRRKESHLIAVEDIKRALGQSPEVIVIGTGESGMARVTEEAKKEIEEKGIKLIIDRTEEAVKSFNIINKKSEKGYSPPTASEVPSKRETEGSEPGSLRERTLEKKTKVIGLFHLTC